MTHIQKVLLLEEKIINNNDEKKFEINEVEIMRNGKIVDYINYKTEPPFSQVDSSEKSVSIKSDNCLINDKNNNEEKMKEKKNDDILTSEEFFDFENIGKSARNQKVQNNGENNANFEFEIKEKSEILNVDNAEETINNIPCKEVSLLEVSKTKNHNIIQNETPKN